MTKPKHLPQEYEHDQAYLSDVLSLIALQLEQAVARFRAVRGDQHREKFLGLFLNDTDIDRMLKELAEGRQLDLTASDNAILKLRRHIARRVKVTPGKLPPQRLADAFGLDQTASDLILYLLAGEMDPRFGRVWAFLQEDVQRRYLTPGLALQLFPKSQRAVAEARLRGMLAAEAPLLRHGLVRMSEPDRPLLERPLKLEDRVADFLLGNDALDADLVEAVDHLRYPQPRVRASVPEPLNDLLLNYSEQRSLPPLLLRDEFGSEWDCWLARKRGVDLLRLRPETGPPTDPAQWQRLLERVRREQCLRDALVSVDGDALSTRSQFTALYRLLPDNIIVTGSSPYEPGTSSNPPLDIHLQSPGNNQREAVWQRHFPASWQVSREKDLPGQLARRYRFSSSQIREICRRLEGRLTLNPGTDTEALWQLCKEAAAQPMRGNAQRVEGRQNWDQLILPAANKARLQELTLRAGYQQQVLDDWGMARLFSRTPGLGALFVGPSGTGKTLAASVMARTLGLELYRVDLATVVSKYIGETEKNLHSIFEHASKADVVLFFDEADALFGKRSEVKDAHDRYANIETSYLLQRIEDHTGLCILASNLAQNIDEAFMRRLQVVVEFPLPGTPERQQLWRQLLSTSAPVSPDLDLDFLARQFELTGGHIKNTLLLAGCYAAEEGCEIGMDHLVRAVAREYGKLGRTVTKNLFGPYYHRLKRMD